MDLISERNTCKKDKVQLGKDMLTISAVLHSLPTNILFHCPSCLESFQEYLTEDDKKKLICPHCKTIFEARFTKKKIRMMA
jgi:hypothetical protein